MVLKAKVESMTLDEAVKSALSTTQANDPESQETELVTRISHAIELYNNFRRGGNLASLEQSISQFQQAANMVSRHDPHRRSLLYHIGLSFLYRFKRLRSIDDADDAATPQPPVAVTPSSGSDSEATGSSSNLGASLVTPRFGQLGPEDDIANATTRHQMTVDPNSDGHSDKAAELTNLGNSLLIQFKHFGCVDDIDNAIAQYQAAVDLTPDDHPDNRRRLTNLGNSLRIRFERFGNVDDINKAIIHHQTVVDLSSDDHPKKPGWLANLGHSFRIRFERFGNISDIEEAISQHQAAVDLIPGTRPNKDDLLGNIGTCLFAWYERCESMEELEKAITQHQATIGSGSDGRGLSNLGHSLRIRFKHLANTKDDTKSPKHRAGADPGPNGYLNTPLRLSNLTSSLVTWFEQVGTVDDFDKKIKQHQAALSLSPDDHYDKPSLLHNLGTAFFTRYIQLHRPGDADAAILHLSTAAQSSFGSPSHRLTAAEGWIHAASISNHPSLLAAYDCALSTVPLVAWLGLPIADRHQHLVQIGAIVRDAAATAISLGHYNKAAEWLEQGRSVVWNQILQLRTPVDRLRDVEPELADQLVHVSRLLGGEQRDPQDEVGPSSQEKGQRNRDLAVEREILVQRIRELPEFKDFLRPPKSSRLFSAAKNGPVIVLNIAKKRCDALALIDGLDEVVHIPLPDFTLEKATKLQADLAALLKSSGVRMRAIRDPEIEGGGDNECKRILAQLWYCLVKPVLDSLAFSPYPEALPRIWWCVTGPLAFLPIHAAGVYDGDSAYEQISNYVISSYTPTLSALIELPNASLEAHFKMLSVIEPSIGRWHIPNTKKELEYIRSHIGMRDHIILESLEATKERAMKAMKDCNWLHLACHGSQDESVPTKSGLKLCDGNLTLEEIIKLDLPQAEFAFLWDVVGWI
ncbi:hypothetical protein FRC14_000878 [Serendipita sp. 396]|nr:hypothetical protein FRC14_000878 [Serendipita sp. 396]